MRQKVVPAIQHAMAAPSSAGARQIQALHQGQTSPWVTQSVPLGREMAISAKSKRSGRSAVCTPRSL